jgi:hypothetical protein
VIAGPRQGPDASDVNVHVRGAAAASWLKSPLIFGAKCGEGAKLTFRVEATSKKEGSHLKIRVGGPIVFERAFRHDPKQRSSSWKSLVNEEFSVDLPAGVHAITVENTTGGGFVRIDRYRFKNLLVPTPEDRKLLKARAAPYGVLGMRGRGLAFLYLRNPAVAGGEQLSLAKMEKGTHSVEWWNTWTGEIVTREDVATADGVLRLSVPRSDRDLACKIRKGRREDR